MSEQNNSSATAGTEDNKAPEGGNSGNAQPNVNTEAAKGLKYKTQEEAEKAYLELEKKFGEHSKEVEEARRYKEQTEILLNTIWSDPDLYRQVEAGVKKYQSGGTLSDDKSNLGKADDTTDKKNESNPQITDLRIAEENRVLDDFFTKYGYKSLSEKDRKESYQRLVVSLAEVYDPEGKKPIKQILSEIPLSKLPRYLENAHFLANKEQLFEKAKRSAALSSEENNAASIGSLSSGSGRGELTVTLSSKEREIANKLGIPEEKYVKRKVEMMKDNSRYES